MLLCGAVLALAPTSYAKNYHMTAANIVPGASAELEVAKEKDGNVQVDLKATHLPKPGRLTPSANAYIVWFQQEGSQPQSQGELRVGDNEKAELKPIATLALHHNHVDGVAPNINCRQPAITHCATFICRFSVGGFDSSSCGLILTKCSPQRDECRPTVKLS